MKKYDGVFVEKCERYSTMVDLGIIGNNGKSRMARKTVMLDCYAKATVVNEIGAHEADENNGVRKSTTIRVAVASANQLRRITGFDEMADKLAELNEGDVITVFGETLFSNQGTGNPNQNGFNVIRLHVISKAELPAENQAPLELQEEGQAQESTAY